MYPRNKYVWFRPETKMAFMTLHIAFNIHFGITLNIISSRMFKIKYCNIRNYNLLGITVYFVFQIDPKVAFPRRAHPKVSKNHKY